MARKKGAAAKSVRVFGPPTKKQAKNRRKRQRQNARRKSMSGHGDYKGAYAKRGAAIGGAIGNLGDMLVGNGDYSYRKNSLMKGGSFTPLPKFSTTGSGHCIQVAQREFLGNVLSTTTFTDTVYPINPGVAGTFPWLSNVASSFEEYEMLGCVFEFVPLSAAWSGSDQALGKVVCSTDYNVLALPFASAIVMENQDFAVSGPPDKYIIHGIECSPRERPIEVAYIRQGVIPTNADLKMYDIGNFQIATEGFHASSILIGELWVSYDVRLFKKSIESSGALETYVNNPNGAGITTTNFFGTGLVTYGDLPVSFAAKQINFYTAATSNRPQMNCPIGVYLVLVIYSQASGAFTGPGAINTYTNCNGNGIGGTATSVLSSTGTGETVGMFTFEVTVTAPSASVLWTSTMAFNSPTQMNCYIIREPSNTLQVWS